VSFPHQPFVDGLFTLVALGLPARSAFGWPDPQTPSAQPLAAASGGSPGDARTLGDRCHGCAGVAARESPGFPPQVRRGRFSSADASAALGAIERDGKGIAPDHHAAYYPFLLAALQCGPLARHLVDGDPRMLARELGPEQTAKLQADANAWHQQHPAVPDFVYKTTGHGGLATLARIAPLHEGDAGDLIAKSP
jgi:hypothetical protein